MAPSPERIKVDVDWLRNQSKNWTSLGDGLGSVGQGSASVRVDKAGIGVFGQEVTNVAGFLSAYSEFETTFEDRTSEGAKACHGIASAVVAIADGYQAQEATTTSNIRNTG